LSLHIVLVTRQGL